MVDSALRELYNKAASDGVEAVKDYVRLMIAARRTWIAMDDLMNWLDRIQEQFVKSDQ